MKQFQVTGIKRLNPTDYHVRVSSGIFSVTFTARKYDSGIAVDKSRSVYIPEGSAWQELIKDIIEILGAYDNDEQHDAQYSTFISVRK